MRARNILRAIFKRTAPREAGLRRALRAEVMDNDFMLQVVGLAWGECQAVKAQLFL